MGPVWETLNRGETYVIEVTNMRADGTRFPVEVHSASLVFDGRKRLVAVARDLSQRREAELRYRELMEVIDKGIVVQNHAREIVYGNRAAMRILGVGEGKRLDEELGPGPLAHRRRERPRDGQRGAARAPRTEHRPGRGKHAAGPVPPREQATALAHGDRRCRSSHRAARQPAQVTSLFSDVTALKRDSALFDRAQSLAHIGGWEWDTGPRPRCT